MTTSAQLLETSLHAFLVGIGTIYLESVHNGRLVPGASNTLAVLIVYVVFCALHLAVWFIRNLADIVSVSER